jgi:hypothetical protein
MRNEETRALASKLFNKHEPHSSLAQPRTFEATARMEVHGLHALGEHDLTDITCGWEGEERKNNKMRNEEARAAGRQNVLN